MHAHTAHTTGTGATAYTAYPGGAARGHRHGTAAWALPVLIGVAFGMYAWFLARDQDFTTTATVIGLVAGVLAMAVCFALARVQWSLVREVRAMTYGGAFGAGTGYLYSLSGGSILTAVVLGLVLGGCLGAAAFYVFYTHED